MDRRTSLSRRVALVGASLLLVVGLAGCEGNGPVGPAPVAFVEGTEITRDQLTELIDAQAAYIEAAQEAGSVPETVDIDAVLGRYQGENDHTIATSGASEALSMLIDIELYRSLLEERGGEVTDADRATVADQIQAQLTQSGITASPELQPLIDAETERGALYTALQEFASDDLVQELIDGNEGEFQILCVQQIVAETAEDGDAARARLDAGEDFVAVAGELSNQPASAEPGNPQSCVLRAQLRSLFGDAATDAATGDVLGPTSAGGTPEVWVVVRIWDEPEPTVEAVRPLVEQQLASQVDAATNELFADMYSSADVEVDPRFGTWTPASGTVTAPTDPLAPPADDVAVDAAGGATAP